MNILKSLLLILVIGFLCKPQNSYSKECANYLQTSINANEQFLALKATDIKGVSFSQNMFHILNTVFNPYVEGIIKDLNAETLDLNTAVATNFNSRIIAYFNAIRFNRSDTITTDSMNQQINLNVLSDSLQTSLKKALGRKLQGFEDTITTSLAQVAHYNVFKNRSIWNQAELQKTRYSQFVWSYMIKSVKQHDYYNFLESSITPIGYYGPELAEAMLLTTQIFHQAISDNQELSSQIMNENRRIFEAQMTARSNVTEGLENAARMAMIEGVVSINQLLSALLLHKVPGAETGYEAVESIIYNSESPRGIMSELTLKLPMGLLGPLVISGHGFHEPLVMNTEGKLELSRDLVEQLKVLKDRAKAKLKPEARSAGAAGVGCPMSICNSINAKSGIQNLTELYFQIFQIVYNKVSEEKLVPDFKPKKILHPDQIFSLPNVEQAVSELKSFYPHLLLSYFHTKFTNYVNKDDTENIKNLIQKPDFKLTIIFILTGIDSKPYFFDILKFYLSGLKTNFNSYEAKILIETMTDNIEIEGFVNILNTPIFIKSITEQLNLALVNKEYNGNLLFFIRLIYKSNNPNLYIQAFINSDLWQQLSTYHKSDFIYNLIYSNHYNVVYDEETLQIMADYVNVYFQQHNSTIFELALNMRNTQLIDYFFSIPQTDVNQIDSQKDPIIFKILNGRMQEYVVFSKFLNHAGLNLKARNHRKQGLLEFLVYHGKYEMLKQALASRKFDQEHISEAFELAKHKNDRWLKEALSPYLISK